MAVTVLTTTGVHPPSSHPTVARPVRLIARNLLPQQKLPAHSHPWGQVTYAMEGVVRVSAMGSSWIVPPLRAIWIAPGIEHELVPLDNARLRALWIDASRAPFAGDDCRVLNVSTLLRELIFALLDLADAERAAREPLLAGLVLNELARSETLPMRIALPRDKRLRALCDALIAEPSLDLTLADWAQRAGASERTLARLFESDLGMPFGQWRSQMRLAHAAPLVARGLPLSVVASELGYASQSAFSAMFKKSFGVSPRVFFADRVR